MGDLDELFKELEVVKERQAQQDAELARIRRGIRNVIGMAAAAQSSIDGVINQLGVLVHGPSN